MMQYMVCKAQSRLPQAALNMIRYHSFYPWHRERAYTYFKNEADKQALRVALRPYYEELIAKFFPEKIHW
jgi:inositol oxygenase